MKHSTDPVVVALLLALIVAQALLTIAVHVVALVVTLATLRRRCPAPPQPPAVHPLFELLDPLSCRELRDLTGCRRKLSRLQLQALAVA